MEQRLLHFNPLETEIMKTPSPTPDFRQRLLLQLLILLDYAGGISLLLVSIRQRRDFASDWALCAGIMMAAAGALLATTFRRRGRKRSAWLCALCGLAAGTAAALLISR